MENELAWHLFMPDLAEQVERLKKGMRLVHYTSAEAAFRILTGRQVWLRNASMMNDFSEIEHGLGCLREGWNSPAGLRLQEMLNRIKPGLRDEVAQHFDGRANELRVETFLISLSEHDDDENDTGRLSMWRAYGSRAGVALVMNNAAFLSETDEMKVFSSPVFYRDERTFATWFQGWSDRVVAAEDALKAQAPDFLREWLFEAFRGFALCTKHPGFREEREWRVYTSPNFEGGSDWLESAIEIVGGLPQRLIKLKLFDDAARAIVGVAPSTLIDRIIIGPCEHPYQVRAALIEALGSAGVANPSEKIWMSLIPLRQ